MSVNRVFLMGRLGRDPETKTIPNGTTLTKFSLAIDEKGKNGEEQTQWINCVAFGKTGEFAARYLSKGRQAHVEGRLSTRTYEKDGQKHWMTEVIANHIEAVGPRPGGTDAPADTNAPAAVAPADDADDLPF